MVSRKRGIPGARYFGPYPKMWAVTDMLEILIKLFPIRTCKDSDYRRAMATGKPCFAGQIGRCFGPCWAGSRSRSTGPTSTVSSRSCRIRTPASSATSSARCAPRRPCRTTRSPQARPAGRHRVLREERGRARRPRRPRRVRHRARRAGGRGAPVHGPRRPHPGRTLVDGRQGARRSARRPRRLRGRERLRRRPDAGP